MICMVSPLWLAVGPRSLLGGLCTKFCNVCPFDNSAFVVSGNVGIP